MLTYASVWAHAEAAPLTPLPVPEIALEKFSGSYRHEHPSKNGFEKLSLLHEDLIILPDGKGNLLQYTWGEDPGKAQVWVCIAPGVFQAKDDANEQRMTFHTDKNGNIKSIDIALTGKTEKDTYEKLAWYESAAVQFYALVAALAIMVSMTLRGALRLIFRRKKTDAPNHGFVARIAWWTSLLCSLVCIVFTAGAAYTLTEGDPTQFASGLPPHISVLLVLPIAVTALACVGTLCILLLIGRRSTPFLSRWHLTLTLSGIWLFIALADYWNLLGYHV